MSQRRRLAAWGAMLSRLRVMLVCTAAGLGTAAAGQFTFPEPEVYARPEDQARARLRLEPCAETDVGRGCYRWDSCLIREAPCTYHVDANTIASVPTDQCYKMEASRRYRGVWLDEFEGQAFIPEGTTAPEWPRGDATRSGWRERFESARASRIWLDVSRVGLEHHFREGGRKVLIEFDGRKTMYPGSYGHLGMSGHEIIVDHMISLKECPETGDCR